MRIHLPFALALLSLAPLPVLADVVIPTGPARRSAAVVEIWRQTPQIVLGECLEAGDAKKPSKIAVKAIAKGNLKEGQEVEIPGLDTFEWGGSMTRKPMLLTLDKGSTYVLFLRDDSGHLALEPFAPVSGYSIKDPDGTVFLPGGACRLAGKAEDCDMWKTLRDLSHLRSGTPKEQVQAVRILVKSHWARQENCSPATLKELEALAGTEDPTLPGLLTSLLNEDLPLLGRRDTGVDELAKRCNVASKDPWSWTGSWIDLKMAIEDFPFLAKKGVDAERAAAVHLIELARALGTWPAVAPQLEGASTPVLKEELRKAFAAATKDTLDWPALLPILNCMPRRDHFVPSDVPALIRIVRSPGYAGSFGEASLVALYHLESLTGGAIRPPIEQRDPAREGAAWGRWWDETGSKDPKYGAVAPGK